VRLREVFHIKETGDQAIAIETPIEFSLGDGERIEVREGSEGGLVLVIERTIDPLELTLETKSGFFELLADGSRRELSTLRVPAGGNVRAIDLASTLTFLTDMPLLVNPADRELLVEGEEDTAALDALGTRLLHSDTNVLLNTRTFAATVNADTLRALLPKTVGLRLYADAVALHTDVAKFRELWRCLESAFGLKDARLVTALANYGPAIEIGFDRRELGELQILRGRISHAESKAGLEELLRAGDEASRRASRLKCLVERVILTKRDWGQRDGGVEELAPASSWINWEGAMEVRQQTFGPSGETDND
jgi:hypothetical protein